MPPQAANTPLVIVIRDGWGRNPHPEHNPFNAVHLACTPVAEELESQWPTTLIHTSGEDVGLPAATMGNSEVGHQNIGAGRIVEQEILRINRAIENGTFEQNEALRGAFSHAEASGGDVHLIGLASDGKVHSDLVHLYALIQMAQRLRWPSDRLLVHAITDGRDTAPSNGLGYIQSIQHELESAGVGRIASVIGRYYAMDRDHRWSRIALAYACLTRRPVTLSSPETEGLKVRQARSPLEAITSYYERPTETSRTGDEFIVPTRITLEGREEWSIGEGDAVIFFNFRGDRPRELTKAFVLDDARWSDVTGGGFDRGERIANLYFCTMTDYEHGLPVKVVFQRPPEMRNILGEVIARLGLTQFRCAETEKFPHVTFFLNDYREDPFPGERRVLVPSPREISTYDQKPEMSAWGVTDAVAERLEAEDCEPLIVVNYANGDMVGHTGVLEAAIKAIETVDECVGRLMQAALKRGGSLIVTADHGNAEQMRDPESDRPHTAHTVYDVPLTVVGEAFRGRRLRDGGRLGDIAPTALVMMGLQPPVEMSGRSLLEHHAADSGPRSKRTLPLSGPLEG